MKMWLHNAPHIKNLRRNKMSWLDDDQIRKIKREMVSSKSSNTSPNDLARKWYAEATTYEASIRTMLSEFGDKYVQDKQYSIVREVQLTHYDSYPVIDPSPAEYVITLYSSMSISITLMVPPRYSTRLIIVTVGGYGRQDQGGVDTFELGLRVFPPTEATGELSKEVDQLKKGIQYAIASGKLGKVYKSGAGLFSSGDWYMETVNGKVHLGKA